ncbi:hypothetical protein Nepgr_029127 [Nepenthes gracilis]|uniref:PDZ domain-containing protein n=1 Tax=Nepenthes gracilis TaxID=150966 RepID=A0AAD3Y4R1_NEPGR|nr:hypothetical protein Nepgr_029127 [Nepenthes gracilis]
MVGTNLKAETMALMDNRSAVEAEMNSIIERLCLPGGPGLSGNLLDSEGFPLADIDIPVVRADRRRLAELKNDHKDLTEKINQNIQLLHASKRAGKSPTFTDTDNQGLSIVDVFTSTSPEHDGSREDPIVMDVDANFSIPFAMVDEISEGSPAAEDGLQLGDQILKFGNVGPGDNLLTRLASEVQTNRGCALPLVVIRQGTQMSLSLTPRTWTGRGLLGCHFRIL